MTCTFGVGHKADKQHAIVGAVWRRGAKLGAPQSQCSFRSQIKGTQTDDIWVLARLRNKFEVYAPDLFERQVIRRHVPPTS